VIETICWGQLSVAELSVLSPVRAQSLLALPEQLASPEQP
jgi:hypothetical protein